MEELMNNEEIVETGAEVIEETASNLGGSSIGALVVGGLVLAGVSALGAIIYRKCKAKDGEPKKKRRLRLVEVDDEKDSAIEDEE